MTTPQLITVKRMAAELLGVGIHRVWIDPERLEDVEDAITREDVRRLIKEGVIKAKPIKGVSRVRARLRHEQRKKGRQRGYGRRKGVKSARLDTKEAWVRKIRAIRKFLKYLRKRRIISRSTYRRLYMLAKGGTFTSVSHVKTYIREHKLTRRII